MMGAPSDSNAGTSPERESSDDGTNTFDMVVRAWLDDQAPYGVLTTDETYRIQSWNRWLESHTGRRASDVVGQKLVDALPELVERRLARYFEEAMAGRAHVLSHRLHGFLILMTTDAGGSRYESMQQSAQIAPLMKGQRVIGTIAMITDVTERAAREADLHVELAARARLLADEHAARTAADVANRAKDDFLAVLSHELRTPLHAILGWTRVLKDVSLGPEKIARGVASIERNAQAQTQLIEDLLDVSRIISDNLRIEKHRVDLKRPIEAAVEIVRPFAEAKGVRLTVTFDPSLCPIAGDAVRLQQIAWNLVGNAVKFTPSGGHVFVEARADEKHIVVSVRDTGRGIAPEFLPHVFERFAQADSSAARQQEGLGLGLAIVKRLVDLHGGAATATSDGVGHGAVFTLTFPHPDVLSDPAPSLVMPAPEIRRSSSATPLAGARILVVDDNEDARELMAMALSHQGAVVSVAGSAAEAKNAIILAAPDVLVSDVGMPGEDGYALIEWLRSAPERAPIPAIAMTGYAGPEAQRRALGSGFNGHLSKPADLDALVSLVAKLVGH